MIIISFKWDIYCVKYLFKVFFVNILILNVFMFLKKFKNKSKKMVFRLVFVI